LFDYIRKFNNESREPSEIKPARDLLCDEKSVVKAEIQTALNISVKLIGSAWNLLETPRT
jgi:hypothetical protein